MKDQTEDLRYLSVSVELDIKMGQPKMFQKTQYQAERYLCINVVNAVQNKIRMTGKNLFLRRYIV